VSDRNALALDHLVVAARSLDEGVRWCEATFGVTPGPGGKHPQMGTHNRLFCIGSEAFPRAYFEIIAIDPQAAAPGRKRWFGLDEIDLRAGPRLVHAVARCGALDAQLAALRTAGCDAGAPIAASRDTANGRLAWRIAVRDDGRLLCGGALPTLIEWGSDHPADAMPASGAALQSLSLRGLPPAAVQALHWPGIEFADGTGPALSATIDAPRGRITLHSH
jgi:hypothetical protein